MWLIITIVSIVLVALLHVVIPKKYNWPSTMRKINKIPGPRGVPYFDNALTFVVSNEEMMPVLIKLVDEYRPILKFSILGAQMLFLTELDDVEIILNSRGHITKGISYDFLVPWLGTGLLISKGKKWFDRRKLLTPAFHFTILEQYLDIMNKNANILCNILQKKGKGRFIPINPLISNCALDIICETAMGTQINAQISGEGEYVRSVIRLSQIFMERLLTPWLYRPLVFNLSPIGREYNRIIKVVHEYTDKVIKTRQQAYRERRDAKTLKESETFDMGEKKKMSFLDLLVEISETQNRLTQEEIREEVDTFMFEGHDTSSAALIWALFELALNPDIQENVYQEQYEIFGDSDREPNLADLQEMKYLERVVKETLRLYPSVPIITRSLEEEVKIRDYVIPAETQANIFIYYIHRNPDIYPEPEKFNPDRFLPEVIRGRHPYSYIPFSAGPRNCIGQKFALMEEKVVLSHIIRRFKVTALEKAEDVKIMGEIILRPKNNLNMQFEERKR